MTLTSHNIPRESVHDRKRVQVFQFVSGTPSRTDVTERIVDLEQLAGREFVFVMRNINFCGASVTREMHGNLL